MEEENVSILLKQIDKYAVKSGKYAAKTFENMKYQHKVFDDKSVIQLTPIMCAEIYRDMIKAMFKEGSVVSQKYGLFAAIVPVGRNSESNEIEFSIELGLVFPNIQK